MFEYFRRAFSGRRLSRPSDSSISVNSAPAPTELPGAAIQSMPDSPNLTIGEELLQVLSLLSQKCECGRSWEMSKNTLSSRNSNQASVQMTLTCRSCGKTKASTLPMAAIAGFAKVTSASNPARSQHYAFVYHTMRKAFFGSPLNFVNAMSQPTAIEFLARSWDESADPESLNEGTAVPSVGIAVSSHVFHGRDAAIVQLPKPQASPEAFFIALVAPANNSNPRYFTLEKTIDFFGRPGGRSRPTGIVCEPLADGGRKNHGLTIEATRSAFAKTVADFLEHDDSIGDGPKGEATIWTIDHKSGADISLDANSHETQTITPSNSALSNAFTTKLNSPAQGNIGDIALDRTEDGHEAAGSDLRFPPVVPLLEKENDANGLKVLASLPEDKGREILVALSIMPEEKRGRLVKLLADADDTDSFISSLTPDVGIELMAAGMYVRQKKMHETVLPPSFLLKYHEVFQSLSTSSEASVEAFDKSTWEAEEFTRHPLWERSEKFMRSAVHGNLASRYREAFARWGRMADIEASIKHFRHSVKLNESAPQDFIHIVKPAGLTNLSTALLDRYSRNADEHDLEEAIECARRAVKLTADGSDERPGRLSNLGNALRRLYSATEKRSDLIEAVSTYESAVQAATGPKLEPGRGDFQPQASLLPKLLTNLSSGYANLFDVDQDITTSDKAIAAAERAVSLTDVGDPFWALRTCNLANAIAQRAAHVSSTGDRNRAISLFRQAIAAADPLDANRYQYLQNLALVLRQQYASTGDKAFVADEIEALTEAQGQLQSSIAAGIESGHTADRAARIGTLLFNAHYEMRNLTAAVETLERNKAIRLRAEIFRARRIPSGLNADQSKLYTAMLSERRSVSELLLTTIASIDARSDSNQVQRHELATKHARLTSELRALENIDPAFTDRAPSYSEIVQLCQRLDVCVVYLQPRLGEKRGTVAAVIHAQSDTKKMSESDFIEFPDVSESGLAHYLFHGSELAFAATDGIMSASVDWQAQGAELPGWYTINVLLRDKPIPEERATYLRRKSLERLLSFIGSTLATPLATHLKTLGQRAAVIVPGGGLSVVPLHAAPVATGEPFGAVVAVRYAPTASVITATGHREGLAFKAQEPVCVCVSNPDGSLPFSEVQAYKVSRLFGSSAILGIGAVASKRWLIENATKADYLDLSTHAQFDPKNYFETSFVLADGLAGGSFSQPEQAGPASGETKPNDRSLGLSDLWAGRLKLKTGCVVVAAACETGLHDVRVSEEFHGFPAAFLLNGAAFVVASLWRVDDFATSLLLEKFYKLALIDGMDASMATTSAGTWLRNLSAEDAISLADEALSELVMMEREIKETTSKGNSRIHVESLRAALQKQRQLLVDSPDAHPFAHPYYWAPFGVYG